MFHRKRDRVKAIEVAEDKLKQKTWPCAGCNQSLYRKSNFLKVWRSTTKELFKSTGKTYLQGAGGSGTVGRLLSIPATPAIMATSGAISVRLEIDDIFEEVELNTEDVTIYPDESGNAYCEQCAAERDLV